MNSIMYYAQTDLICVALLGFLTYMSGQKFRNAAAEDRIFSGLIWATQIFSISDFLAWVANGRIFFGSVFMNYLANIIYISVPPVFSFMWCDYILCKTKGKRLYSVPHGRYYVALLIAVVLLVFTTPLTGFAFTVDQFNNYHRAIGAYICPSICWIFLLGITLSTYLSAKKNKRVFDHDSLNMVLSLIIPIIVCLIIQSLFYGVVLTQFGFTFGLLIVLYNNQKNQISLDELTGLNNRRELNKYIEKILNADEMQKVCICMLDADHFKQINDKFGHLEGDNALKTLSGILKRACGATKNDWFLSRYGGDEFIIVGLNKSPEHIRSMREHIYDELKRVNSNAHSPYTLGLSFGYAEGMVAGKQGILELIDSADEEMYKEKAKHTIDVDIF